MYTILQDIQYRLRMLAGRSFDAHDDLDCGACGPRCHSPGGLLVPGPASARVNPIEALRCE